MFGLQNALKYFLISFTLEYMSSAVELLICRAKSSLFHTKKNVNCDVSSISGKRLLQFNIPNCFK